MTEQAITAAAIDAVTANTAKALLNLRAETASRALAELLVSRYWTLSDEQKTTFLTLLLTDFGADRGAVDDAISTYRDDPSEANTVALAEAADSDRLPLFRALNVAPSGIDVLLDLRAELLKRRRTHPDLAPVDRDLKYLLNSWFNRGFLTLRQLDWQTPAHILESLIRSEAVHEIRGWGDLRRRLAPDRRSFGFFHAALPDEPIIFVEVALVNGLAESIQDVLDAPAPDVMPDDVDTAIFYSITNCQVGLRGISFGSFLIKQVTEQLSAELPQLTTFSTLSPVPGLAGWLAENEPEIDTMDQRVMEQACARYLVTARSRSMPHDAVARFHMRNGACLERINWMGDTSDKGMGESHGVLVNYLYSGQDLADNHDALTLDGIVTVSPEVAALVGEAGSHRIRS